MKVRTEFSSGIDTNILATGSTTERTVEDRFAERFNVMDGYGGIAGATADNVADDAPSIQSAIDQAEVNGGVVYIPPGTYRIASTLTIQASNVVLRGDGGSSVLRGDLNANLLDLNGAAASKAFRLHLADLEIQYSTDRTSGAAIRVGNIGQSRFEGIRISNALGGRPYDGIIIDSGTQLFFDNVRINGSANNNFTLGVPNSTSDSNVADIWATDCQFDDAQSNGVLIQNTQATLSVGGLYFTRCSIFGTTGVAVNINVSGGATNGQYFFDDVILDSSTSHGLLTQGSSTIVDLRLFDVWAGDNNGHGIFLHDQVTDFEVTGGFVLFNNQTGVTANCDRGTVQNIKCFDNNQGNAGDYGISVGATASDISIGNNRLYNTARKVTNQNGLIIASGASGIVVNDNFLDTGSGTTSFSDSGTATKIYRNVGYVTENWGNASISPDANGNGTIVHGLAATPDYATVGIEGDNVNGVDVQSLDATNITVRIKDASGADVAAGTFTIHWEARLAA